MAFGATSVLDDFNRADAATLGANWTEPMASADTSSNMSVASNTVGPGGAVISSAYWNPATFGPDCEAYATITNKVDTKLLFARVHEFTSTYPDGYNVNMSNVAGAGNDTLALRRVDDGVGTLLGATMTVEFANGDGFGIECIGDQIAAYRRDAGVWAQIGVRTDATYNVEGNIGLRILGTTDSAVRLDDFGGGTVGAADPEGSLLGGKLIRGGLLTHGVLTR